MKIAILGNLGNMGQRYTAICKYLGQEVEGYDVKFDNPETLPRLLKWCDRVIIATPTSKHYEQCKMVIKHKKQFLVEKPLSFCVGRCMEIERLAKKNKVKGNVVCNWKFTHGPRCELVYKNQYNFYKTGPYGLPWDACQLLMLTPEYLRFKLKNTSPLFAAYVNGEKISLDAIDKSYVVMIKNWFMNSEYLWSLADATEMTCRCWIWDVAHGNNSSWRQHVASLDSRSMSLGVRAIPEKVFLKVKR
jgi:hypothetical protein